MASSNRTRCDHCRAKGVVILPDDTLVCYAHYNEHVMKHPKVKARMNK